MPGQTQPTLQRHPEETRPGPPPRQEINRVQADEPGRQIKNKITSRYHQDNFSLKSPSDRYETWSKPCEF